MAASGNLSAVLYGVGDLRIEERPVPEPGPDEVLVEVRSVGVCGSDVHYYEHGRIGDFVVRDPLVLGHETSGVVVGRGSRARRLRTGQRVALEPGVPCGRCRECRTGRYNLCPYIRFFATPPVDGTFARYVVIHEDFAHPLPDQLDDDAGALMEPLCVGVWANRRAGTGTGTRVLVTGAGPVGLLTAQVALASGAPYVAVLDINPDRLALARRLGIEHTIDAGGSVELADVDPDILIECTGAPSALRAGIRALRPRGVAVVVGVGTDPDLALPFAPMHERELTLTTTFRYANSYPDAIALAAAGRVQLAPLIGARLPLERAEDALRMPRTDPAVLKTVVAVGNP